ncbi:MAG: hypothetical protein OSJ72_03085 [Lachnospiraceae bacterium]|nr:hypothetical protein [Lachnospiraceae bacterium]
MERKARKHGRHNACKFRRQQKRDREEFDRAGRLRYGSKMWYDKRRVSTLR